MIINGAWYLDTLPQCAVVELCNKSLIMFYITPFRIIDDKDFLEYKGYHPRKCKGQPLPDYLYKFYGLEKNTESATEVIHTRLTPTEKSAIEAAAKNNGKTTSDFIREYIRTL